MKKLVFIFITLFLMSACTQDKAPAEKADFSRKAEIEKDVMAVQIIEVVDHKAIDAFGRPLIEGQWYAIVNANKNAFPISWTANGASFNFDDDRAALFFPRIKMEKELARISVTSGECFGAAVDVDMLLLGNHHLILLNGMESDGNIKATIR